MRRYHVKDSDCTFDPSGAWVRHDDAQDAIQDERDKLARIQKVAQFALRWPETALLPAIVTILQICKEGKASPIPQKCDGCDQNWYTCLCSHDNDDD